MRHRIAELGDRLLFDSSLGGLFAESFSGERERGWLKGREIKEVFGFVPRERRALIVEMNEAKRIRCRLCDCAYEMEPSGLLLGEAKLLEQASGALLFDSMDRGHYGAVMPLVVPRSSFVEVAKCLGASASYLPLYSTESGVGRFLLGLRQRLGIGREKS